MSKTIINQLTKITENDEVKINEPMKLHTTFRIGGNAKYFVTPHSIKEIEQIIVFCRQQELPYYILGNGSNLLVSDTGYDGVIIQLYKNFNQIRYEGSCLTAEAGALLSSIAAKAAGLSLTGFEFAAGIPGTIGGAVVMNAGAYDGEMKQVVQEVTVLDNEGKCRTLQKEELELGYRKSILQRLGYIALEISLNLKQGSQDRIYARMEELKELRISKQPLEFPSAGSTFKRPENNYAGKLIMESGLRGFQIGGAKISEKHCGFVINEGNATAQDVYSLITHVKKTVFEKSGVMLEMEVKTLGEF